MDFVAYLKDKAILNNNNDQLNEQFNIDEELENILNHSSPLYNEKEYWNNRYEKEPNEYEWYQNWNRLKPIFTQYINSNSIVLDVGCGTSNILNELIKEGISKGIGIDFSEILISKLKNNFLNESKLEFILTDCIKLPFQDNSFDFIYDKGTLDSLISTIESTKNINLMIKEIYRVLKPNGHFIEISYGTPTTRSNFLKSSNFEWNLIETKKIEKIYEPDSFHFIYIIKKN